jgi:hypothetical protein
MGFWCQLKTFKATDFKAARISRQHGFQDSTDIYTEVSCSCPTVASSKTAKKFSDFEKGSNET